MLEVIIAVAAAILLGNILAHRMRVPPAVLLIFLGLMLALIPAHQLNEVREVGLPPHVILEIFLPVMLFWETRNTSWHEAHPRRRRAQARRSTWRIQAHSGKTWGHNVEAVVGADQANTLSWCPLETSHSLVECAFLLRR